MKKRKKLKRVSQQTGIKSERYQNETEVAQKPEVNKIGGANQYKATMSKIGEDNRTMHAVK